ncbi:DUF6990 domain-containing protein [Idiomarina sp.]|uniref:DUF6990 domain-containing protein n=1 Tax=Idiomarina sp. TaxID=1874361 RepID=UPI003A8CE8A1
MMTKAEMITFFKSQYPMAQKEEEGWRFILNDDDIYVADTRLQLFDYPLGQSISALPTLTPRWFDSLRNEIFQYESSIPLFTTDGWGIEISTGWKVSESNLVLMAKMINDWVHKRCSEEFIAKELKDKYRAHNRRGTWPFIHIITCVLKGDVDKLQGYLDAFKRGDRMEFIPIIKQEYFERAIPLAEKYRSGELVSPIEF